MAGEACADVLRGEIEAALKEVPGGRSRDDTLAQAFPYYEVTRRAMPWVVEEFDGMAEALGVDPVELFAATIEEISPASGPAAGSGGPAGAEGRRPGRCSDLVAAPPSTTNGHLLVAHNNDLSPEDEDRLVAIEWDIPGDPLVLTIGVGPFPSCGWNSAGISFTGNELTPNDERVGIPRLVQFRAMLREPTLEGAIDTALHTERASSYNNVLAHRDGRAVNVEGSASDAELTETDDAGFLVHTNHYACDSMLPYEGDPEYAKHSAIRYRRGLEMLRAAEKGSMTEDSLRAMLSDHENAPDSVCRHPEFGSESKTVFWCVADVTEMRIAYGRGNPCDSKAQEYSFARS